MTRKITGFFVTIEHADGLGGTTLRDGLYSRLEAAGYDVVKTAEPGGTAFGQEIRRLLGLHGDTPWQLSKPAEMLLYQADRAQHYKEVLKPALTSGKIVICDRYFDSTLAYQGHGRGWKLVTLLRLHHIATGMLLPDLTVIVDGKPHRDLSAGDVFERDSSLQERVRAGYLQIAKTNDRYVVVDGSQDPETLLNQVYDLVIRRMQSKFMDR